MNTAELDDFMAFNDQLLALIEAGVPIEASQEIPDRDLSAMLTRINASVARRVSRGNSVEEALEAEKAVPDWYRNLIVSGLQSDDMDAALREFSRLSNSAEESRFVTESALFYPLVVCGLAYLGMIGFCLFFVPRMESASASFGIQPGTGLAVLRKLRDTLPIWVAIPPTLLLLFVAWRFRRRSHRTFSASGGFGLLAAVSGTSNAMYQQRCAHFAESVASLEENNVPLGKALALAAGVCSDRSLEDGARSLATTVSSGLSVNMASAEVHRFPPFMRWALFQSESTVGRNRALRMAAALYRDSSSQSMRRAKVIAPIIGLVFLGGGVTLLYGLALFVPVIQMLKAVASAH
jgi:type II secretory pathway component PulF